MNKEMGFRVFQKDGIVGFENKSNMNLLISIKPIRPKRRYNKILVVEPNSYKLFINPEIQFDLSELSFTWELP